MAALIVVGSAACSSDDTSAGEALFAESFHDGVRGCVSCHTVTNRPSVGGPSLVGIGAVAGNRVDGMDAADYIRESILAPDAHYADGWGTGMPSYAAVLTEDQVEAIVTYLVSLR